MTKPIGYGSPPEHSRWPKGKSGNPKGRPKRPASIADDLLAELAEVIQVTQGGKATTITKQRAVIKALAAGAIKGDVRAANLLLVWLGRIGDADPASVADPDLTAEERKILDDYLEREVQTRLLQRKEDDQ